MGAGLEIARWVDRRTGRKKRLGGSSAAAERVVKRLGGEVLAILESLAQGQAGAAECIVIAPRPGGESGCPSSPQVLPPSSPGPQPPDLNGAATYANAPVPMNASRHSDEGPANRRMPRQTSRCGHSCLTSSMPEARLRRRPGHDRGFHAAQCAAVIAHYGPFFGVRRLDAAVLAVTSNGHRQPPTSWSKAGASSRTPNSSDYCWMPSMPDAGLRRHPGHDRRVHAAQCAYCAQRSWQVCAANQLFTMISQA